VRTKIPPVKAGSNTLALLALLALTRILLLFLIALLAALTRLLVLLSGRIVSGLLTGFLVFVCHFVGSSMLGFPKRLSGVIVDIGTISYGTRSRY